MREYGDLVSGSGCTRWAFDISALTPTAELLAADRTWATKFWNALTPHSGAGTYVNFLAERWTRIASASPTGLPSTTGSRQSRPSGISATCSTATLTSGRRPDPDTGNNPAANTDQDPRHYARATETP